MNYYALDFPDSGITSAEVTVAMPSDWNAGTVTAQFYWTGIADTTTNAVVWGIEGRSYGGRGRSTSRVRHPGHRR